MKENNNEENTILDNNEQNNNSEKCNEINDTQVNSNINNNSTKTDENNEEKKNKAKIMEKISLTFKRKILVDGMITFLLIVVLCVGYVSLNLWVRTLNLEDIDFTANKRYTLSDASKQAISKVNQDIKIYVYGYKEDSTFIGLLKQYCNTNDKIHYEIITEENNPALIQQYSIQEGYFVVILECGEAKKVIDASSEFTTYDYTTYESVDVTEQVMTNSILSLTDENKPKITGHNEYNLSEMTVLTNFLKNEAFEYDTLNIFSSEAIPEDCNILAIMSPTIDFFETEITEIKNYINKGGNIYITMDTDFKNTQFPNLQLLLEEYGCSIQNGYIIEQENGHYANANFPYLILPEVSQSNKITADIYSAKTQLILMFASKIVYKDDQTLSSLNVTKETLLSSSDNSLFITNVMTSNLNDALKSAEKGKSDISALFSKEIATTNEQGEETTNNSEMILVSCGRFIADTNVSELGASYPLSAYGSNKDFVINGLSYLGKKENNLTIRKDIAGTSYKYTASESQDRVVKVIIFCVPLLIIFIGVFIWLNRKKRK